MANVNRVHQAKKQSNFGIGWNDNRVVYIASTKSSQPKILVCCLNKLERKYIQEQQPN